MKSNVGFIGLGVMGRHMAGHLLAAGHAVRVFTRTASKARELLERGALWEATPGGLAAQSEVVITMIGTPRDVEEVYFGSDGILAAMRPGARLIDMTTSTPELAVRIAAAATERGGAALDAPVSGGERGAREATLSIMVGGQRATFETLRPLLDLMGRNIVYQGSAGSGQHCKLCNQIAVAANMLGACEALAYATRAGLDPATVLASIAAGAAGSWTLSNLAPRILAGDVQPGFAVRHFVKDLGIAVAAAQALKLDLPGLELAERLYRRLAAEGAGELGTQALARLYGIGG